MGGLWMLLAVTLIASGIATADDTCGVLNYNADCSCHKNVSKSFFLVHCPKVASEDSPHFEIQYNPGKYVGIVCVNNPIWSTFQYGFSPVSEKVEDFHFINCDFEGDVDMSAIAKMVGADKAVNLEFVNTVSPKNLVLKKEHFRGMTNIMKLTISENYHLENLAEDFLEYVPQLTTLVLRNNKIASIPTKFFEYVPNLISLELENQAIQRFDDKIFQHLKNLKYLNISSDQLIEVQSGSFDGMVWLESLHFHSQNQVTLPVGIFDKLVQLREVHLSGSHIETSMSRFKKFGKWIISKFGIGKGFPDLPSGLFKNLKNLKKVEIDGCDMKTVPEDIFQGASALEEIHFEGNALRTLPVGLFNGLEMLTKIYLQSNQIEDLPDNIFSSCKNLKELNLSQNKIKKISNSLFTGLESLVHLIMDYNNVTFIEKKAFVVFENVIEEINLSHNDITDLKDTTVEGDVSIFAGCKKLQRLDLSYNKIPIIFKDWIEILPVTLQFLNLSNNKITVIKKEHFNFKNMVDFVLNLASNQITTIDMSGGLDHIFTGDSSNLKTKVQLYVRNNPFICDCSLFDFISYCEGTMQKDMRVRDRLKINMDCAECFGPGKFHGFQLSNLRSRDLCST